MKCVITLQLSHIATSGCDSIHKSIVGKGINMGLLMKGQRTRLISSNGQSRVADTIRH